MDNAVYTFEQLLYQNMAEQSGEELIKNIHRSQDRVLKVSQPETFLNKSNARNLCSIQRVLILSYLIYLFMNKATHKVQTKSKWPCVCSYRWQKYDYDSSTVRKKFFREALLQIIIPYMLKQLHPVYAPVSITHHSSCVLGISVSVSHAVLVV